VELLVVIAILALLAALLFPVLSRAKEAGKKTSCLGNALQIGRAQIMYTDENDGRYPQVKRFSAQPEVDDSGGQIEEPDYGSVFVLIYSYTGGGTISADDLSHQGIYRCPTDPDPFGKRCMESNPDAPPVTSYLVNAFFVFGLSEQQVERPSTTIYAAERRSVGGDGVPPYCDDLYRPWFTAENPDAFENEMDEDTGAISTRRHNGVSNYLFADGHAKGMRFTATYGRGVNLHTIR
jgi:prepilin-type processing-associated H-X9-DG protein